jgi:DivIVA domain-containing protein
MELTSQAINEAEFSMARRGYDPDQVDEFLEKLAVAVDKQRTALEEARGRAAQAEERAAEAERRLGERPERVVEAGPSDEDLAAAAERNAELTAEAEAELETLQRTLLLAQKTADATVRDAEEEARRLIAKAEDDARAAEESTRTRLLEEISRLDSDRSSLEADVAALNGHLEEQRRHLRGAIADLERLLTDPARLKESPAPELSDVAAPAEAAGSEPAGDATGEAAPLAADPDPDPAADADLAAAAQRLVTADELGRHGRAEPEGQAPDAEGGGGPASGRPDGDPDDEAWARFGPDADAADDDGGPPTQPVLRLDDLDQDRMPQSADAEDAYLSELRKAMLEDRSAPELDEAYGEGAGRQRFGRRR